MSRRRPVEAHLWPGIQRIEQRSFAPAPRRESGVDSAAAGEDSSAPEEDDWIVASHTLSLWTRSKLVQFHNRHLGLSDTAGYSDDKLRQDASTVIQGQLVSMLQRQDRQHMQQLTASYNGHIELLTGQLTTLLAEKHQTVTSLIEMNNIPKPPAPAPPPHESTSPHSACCATQSASPRARAGSNWLSPRKKLLTGALKLAKHEEFPQVIFSYQSTNVEFMKKLRKYLNDAGIPTVDEFTFAVDKGKKIIPIVCDPAFQNVLDEPEKYTEEDEDIERNSSKIEALLIKAGNRIPGGGDYGQPFEQNFEENAAVLLETIRASLASSRVCDDLSCGIDLRGSSEAMSGMGGIKETVEFLKKQTPSGIQHAADCHQIADDHIKLLKHFKALLNDNTDEPVERCCAEAIAQDPAQMLYNYLMVPVFMTAAADCVKILCMLGGTYGDGLGDFRSAASKLGMVEWLLDVLEQDGALEANDRSRSDSMDSIMLVGVRSSSLDSIILQNPPSGNKSHTNITNITRNNSDPNQNRDLTLAKAYRHTAIVTLVYLTRCKLGKSKLAECGGIQILVQMVNDSKNTSESQAQALQLLWNAVYETAHKKVMIEAGIVDILIEYMNDPKAQPKGVKCVYFVLSHLAHKYPEDVYESGIVEQALLSMASFQTPISPVNAQRLEGICRLLWSLTLSDKTRRFLSTPQLIQELYRSLQVNRCHDESGGFNVGLQNKETQKQGCPRDAHKMRAAAALDELAKDETLSEARCAANDKLQMLELEASGAAALDMILWLGVQPFISTMILDKPWVIEGLKTRLHSNASCSVVCDVITLLLVTMKSPEELVALLHTEVTTQDGDVTTKLRVQEHLLNMLSNEEGHNMCTRWSVLCSSLSRVIEIVLKCPQESIHFVAPLVHWLQGGHPYKADAEKLLAQTSVDLDVRRRVSTLALEQRSKLSIDCQTGLEANPNDLELVEQALTELSQQ